MKDNDDDDELFVELSVGVFFYFYFYLFFLSQVVGANMEGKMDCLLSVI